jgi:uroporphyrinogen decarboxylase
MAHTARQRVITAMRREVPDRVPKYADFSPGLYDTFVRETGVAPPPRSPWSVWSARPIVVYQGEIGASDPAEYFDYDVRIVEFGETERSHDFSRYLPAGLPPERTRVDEWGIAWVRGSEHHFETMVHPLANAVSAADIEAYPWPDVTADYRREVAQQRIEAVQAREIAALGWPPFIGGTFFELAWRLRGLDNFLVDLVTNQEFAACLLDTIGALSIDNCCFLARCGVDVLLTGDDVGMQDRMLISPAMWRKWLKPRYAELFARVKAANADTLIFYHSDGYIEPIIPELIEIGVEILNPVQPECMDPAAIKRQYGHKLAFWGTVGTQTTFPQGTPAQVRALVKERIETVGAGGGLLLAPSHKLEPDVPWENVVAFFEAIDEYGAHSP